MKNTDVSSSATAGIQGFNEYGYIGGLRIWKKITRGGSVAEHRVHIHAGPNLVAEYNAGVAASTPVQEYVYAGEIDSLVLIRRSNGTKYGASRNRQWSVVALHDLANGNVVERYAYEMTGKRTIYAANGTTVRTTSSYGNNFGYTSRWHDEESRLMYFRARYYNPLTGEFLSRDPMEFVDGMSLHRGYFGLQHVDPTGKTCQGKKAFCEVIAGPEYNIKPKKKPFLPRKVKPIVPWRDLNGDRRAKFELSAKFRDDPGSGAECRCCEIRQYIKWTQEFLDTNGDPPRGFPRSSGPDTWHEDRDGQDKRYGHRAGRHSACGLPREEKKRDNLRIDDYFDEDPANPGALVKVNCPSGCVYFGNDAPGGPIEAVKKVRGKMEFYLEVVDVCNPENGKPRFVKKSGVIVVSFDDQEEVESGD